MSAAREALAARRAELVARAALDRAAIAKQLEFVRSIEGGLERLGQTKPELPALAVSAGLGLSALLLALPSGQGKILKAGLSLFRLAGSVRKLFSAR